MIEETYRDYVRKAAMDLIRQDLVKPFVADTGRKTYPGYDINWRTYQRNGMMEIVQPIPGFEWNFEAYRNPSMGYDYFYCETLKHLCAMRKDVVYVVSTDPWL